MRVTMVISDMNSFGGLEEFAKNLAIGIQHLGHDVSVLSTFWVAPDNQYMRQLREKQVTVVQLPRWISLLTADWATKEKIATALVWLSFPLAVLLSVGLMLARRQAWGKSFTSARNWLRGQWMERVVRPDRRKPFVRFMLLWWKLRWRPDLLHIHGYTSALLFVIDWAYANKLPVVYQEHQTPDKQFDWWKDFHSTINKATIVVGVSEKSASALKEVCGVTQPVVVAYYMVEDPADSGWSRPPEPASAGQPVRVTTLARLYVTKGLTYLLEAIVRVKAVHPDAQFRVYGDGPLRDELLQYAARLGLDGAQIFVGAFTSRAELAQIMRQTDLFVMSSILEGLPISLLEAMSYGCPIVTTMAGGSAEAITDGVNGLLCEPRNPECLAEKIITLLADPALRASLGRAARKSYEESPFRPVAVAKHFISIYGQALQLTKA